MKADTFTLRADDGAEIFVHRWLPDGTPRGVVRISHGMAEHSARYARTATALTDAGLAVYAHDHRGHGQTAQRGGALGHFSDEDGWLRVIADVRAVGARAREEYPDVPVILLGHSMGSFMVQWIMLRHADDADGYVLSGSNVGGGALVSAGKQAAKLERLRVGARRPSALLTFLSFGSFNKGFEGRTSFDWLSRDPVEVDKYVADSLCGFDVSTQLWIDLLGALEELGRGDWSRVGADKPVYVFAGDQDPVGDRTRGLEKLLRAMEAGGMSRVTSKFYVGGRHEMVNETNRDEVFADLVAWIERNLFAA